MNDVHCKCSYVFLNFRKAMPGDVSLNPNM